MNEELFDRRIKELADSARVTPDADIWEKIRKRLSLRRRFVIVGRIVSGAAVAAVLVLGIILLPVNTEDNPVPAGNGTVVAERMDSGQGTGTHEDIVIVVKHAAETGSGLPELLAEAYAGDMDGAEEVYVPGGTEVMNEGGPIETGMAENTEIQSKEEIEGQEGKDEDIDAAVNEEMSFYGLWDDPVSIGHPASSNRKRNRFAVTASSLLNPSDASGNVDFSSQSFSSGLGNASSGAGIVPISLPEHSFPVTVGVNVIYSFLDDRLGVGLGLNYTFMKSSYEALINQASQSIVQQRLHYLGIPLDFYVNFVSAKGFRLYADVGGMMEKGLNAVYNVSEITNNQYTIEESIEGLQWSVNVGIGFEYRFVDFAGLYLDPKLTYFFDCGQPYSVRTEQPLQFGLQFGFRFHI